VREALPSPLRVLSLRVLSLPRALRVLSSPLRALRVLSSPLRALYSELCTVQSSPLRVLPLRVLSLPSPLRVLPLRVLPLPSPLRVLRVLSLLQRFLRVLSLASGLSLPL